MKQLTVKNIAIATLCAAMAFGSASAMADGQDDGILVKFVNTDYTIDLSSTDDRLHMDDFTNGEASKGSIDPDVLTQDLFPDDDTVTYIDNGTVTTTNPNNKDIKGGYPVKEIVMHTPGDRVGAILNDSLLDDGDHELSINFYNGPDGADSTLANKKCKISINEQPERIIANLKQYKIPNNGVATISCPFSSTKI